MCQPPFEDVGAKAPMQQQQAAAEKDKWASSAGLGKRKAFLNAELLGPMFNDFLCVLLMSLSPAIAVFT
jgi:hypothetical protein